MVISWRELPDIADESLQPSERLNFGQSVDPLRKAYVVFVIIILRSFKNNSHNHGMMIIQVNLVD